MKKTIVILSVFLSMMFAANAQTTKTIAVTAGGLKKALTYNEMQVITHLILTGSLDARDFAIMRDRMPNLQVVDLTKINIVEYSGEEGTKVTKKAKKVNETYAAKTIPQYAFYKASNATGKRTIQNVILSKNLVAVGEKAFYACYNLTEVTFPKTVTSLEAEAYSNCKTLSSITLLGDAPIAKMGKGVFDVVDPSTCILHVKSGTKDAFSSAKQWENFMNIEEDVVESAE
jgi:hypothetical protein